MRNSTEPGASSRVISSAAAPSGILQRQADGCVERRGEAFGECPRVVTACLGGVGELLMNALEIRA